MENIVIIFIKTILIYFKEKLFSNLMVIILIVF